MNGDTIPSWLPPLACAGIGTAIVLLLTARARAKERRAKTAHVVRGATIQMTCGMCHKQLVIPAPDMRLLTNVEMALSVRVLPELTGRKLAEYVCPYCEASHCFAVDRRKPEWVGVNLYSPHTKAARCLDCGKVLRTPPWAPGTYDGRLRDAPYLDPDYGLVCSRCQAVVCVDCTVKATRNRTKDGSFVCPRCARTPVDRTFHPA